MTTKIFDVVVESVDDSHCKVRMPDGSVAQLRRGLASTAGQVGLLEQTKAGFVFAPYVEQRLRRMPEKDVDDGYWWWRLEGESDDEACAVKAGVVPGLQGFFEMEDVYPVALDVPREFLDLCKGAGVEPAAVLRLFIADACVLKNTPQKPREDAYAPSDAPERHKAAEYFRSLLQALS